MILVIVKKNLKAELNKLFVPKLPPKQKINKEEIIEVQKVEIETIEQLKEQQQTTQSSNKNNNSSDDIKKKNVKADLNKLFGDQQPKQKQQLGGSFKYNPQTTTSTTKTTSDTDSPSSPKSDSLSTTTNNEVRGERSNSGTGNKFEERDSNKLVGRKRLMEEKRRKEMGEEAWNVEQEKLQKEQDEKEKIQRDQEKKTKRRRKKKEI